MKTEELKKAVGDIVNTGSTIRVEETELIVNTNEIDSYQLEELSELFENYSIKRSGAGIRIALNYKL